VRGSIRTKVAGRVYELRVALGKDPVTGRYRQKSVTVRGSRAEARRALRRLLEEVEEGQHRALEGGSRTFGELLDEWLAHQAAADCSPTTIARDRSVIEWQLKPALGEVLLEHLETKAFDDLYRSLAARLEPASIRKLSVISLANPNGDERRLPSTCPNSRPLAKRRLREGSLLASRRPLGEAEA
jgi:Phage integrase, N-terminal SAM-like domain